MKSLILVANVYTTKCTPPSKKLLYICGSISLNVAHGNANSWSVSINILPSNRDEKFSFALIGPEPMDISTTSTSQPGEIPSSDVTILEGHTSEVKYIINASFVVNLNFLLYTVSSVKLLVNSPVYHPYRCVLVHGVLQDLYLHQGGYLHNDLLLHKNMH